MLHLQLVLQHKRLLISATNTYMGMSLVIADKRFTLQLQGEHLLCVSKFPSPLSFFFLFLFIFVCLFNHIVYSYKKKRFCPICVIVYKAIAKSYPFFFSHRLCADEFFQKFTCWWLITFDLYKSYFRTVAWIDWKAKLWLFTFYCIHGHE